MKGKVRIESIYAFLVVDADGTEGVPAIETRNGMLPLIATDKELVERWRAILLKEPAIKGLTVKLVEFTSRTDIEEFVA